MTNKEAQIALANLKRYMSGGGTVDRVTNKAIDMAIEVLGKPEPKWIPVSERLPEEYQKVLVTTERGLVLGAYYVNVFDHEWCVGLQDYLRLDQVLAWMPRMTAYKVGE